MISPHAVKKSWINHAVRLSGAYPVTDDSLFNASEHFKRLNQHGRVRGAAHKLHEASELLRKRDQHFVFVLSRLCMMDSPNTRLNEW